MASRIFKFNSPEELCAWGGKFAKRLRVGDVIALIGGLGAGKTTLVQSIAKAWGYREGASSPTFALANEYRTPRGMIYHMDMYRLTKKEIAAFPIEDYWGSGLCLIEWADRIRARLPVSTEELHLDITGPQSRALRMGKAAKAKKSHGR